MAKRKPDMINRFVTQVEKNTTKLKKDLKRFSRNSDLPHRLEEIAGELRRGAATVAAEVEHYLHELRAPKTTRKRAAKRTRKTTARRTRKSATKRANKTAAPRAKKTGGKKRARKR